MKRVLPLLLIVCTLLALSFTVFAGVRGIRLATVEKTNVPPTLDGKKDVSYKDGFDIGNKNDPVTHGKMYLTWDPSNLYLFVEITDKNLQKYRDHYPADPFSDTAATKADGSPTSLVTHSKSGGEVVTFTGMDGVTRSEGQMNSWTVPSFEIVIDPTNSAAEDAKTLWQARISYTGYNVFFMQESESYQSYDKTNPQFRSRVTAVKDQDSDDQIGYNIEIAIPTAKLGLSTNFKDNDQVSFNAMYYATKDEIKGNPVSRVVPTKITVGGQEKSVPSVGSNNWNAPYFSFVRLWDPAVTPNRADIPEETTFVTSTTTAFTLKPHKPPVQRTTTTPATTTAAAASDGGCGSVIGAGAAVLASLMIVPTALLLKKKHED